MTGAAQPMLPDIDGDLSDAVLDLVGGAGRFTGTRHVTLNAAIGDLVRSMNCYYSNLIEGHNTKLVDIERALNNDYSDEPKKRDLQLEARAHIEVQRLIDRGEMPFEPLSVEGICWIQREFCTRLPQDLLKYTDPVTHDEIFMIPGELRTHHVEVGKHQAPEPDALPTLLNRFVEAYTSRMLSRTQQIVSVAAAHHRLAWIHPFMDGNGRVTRLLSHAMLRQLGIGSELWSVSRGLSRNVENYKALLMAADEPRQGDLDGRGTLTESGLQNFCLFFLNVCTDQVNYMEELLRPGDLLARIKVWVDEQVQMRKLPNGSFDLLREAVLVGEFPRSRAAEVTRYKDRQARSVMSELISRGLLVSDTPKGSVRLAFPSEVIERWFPGLYAPSPEPEPADTEENGSSRRFGTR